MNNLIYQSYLTNKRPAEYVLKSSESIRSYSARYNTDYIFTRNTKQDINLNNRYHLYYNILDIMDPFYDQYDNILYIDCDVYADPTAGNMFNMVEPLTDVVAVPENQPTGSHNIPGFWKDPHAKEFEEKYARFNCPTPYDSQGRVEQLNTGVIIFTKKGRIKMRETFEDWKPWADDPNGDAVLNTDQPFICGMFVKHKFNVKRLGDEWNMPAAWFKRYSACPRSHFYHFSGSGKVYMKHFDKNNPPAGYYFTNPTKEEAKISKNPF